MGLFRKKNLEDIESDWRDLNALPHEVVSKKELDALQKEVIDELEKLQADTLSGYGENNVEKPQTLYYYHKYIDSKFNKEDFDVDTYFTGKQNIIDQKYAEGLGDVRAEYVIYKDTLAEIQEIDRRLRRKTNKLDPTSNIDLDATGSYDDSEDLLSQINEIPKEIDWDVFKEDRK